MIRLAIASLFLILGLFIFFSEVVGFYKFKYVMNRMHAGGVGDTLGLFCVVLAMAVASGSPVMALKLLLILAIMWFTSPVSTHFLAKVEYYTDPELFENAQLIEDPERQEEG